MSDQQTRVLVLVFDGIEEIEALTPVDILRRAEMDVTVASVSSELSITGRNQINFSADTSIAELDPTSFDLVVLPGGPGVLQLLDNEPLRKILVKQNQSGKRVAAICAAPKVLAKHGILEGREATSHLSVRGDLPSASEAPVVTDGNVTTSQGMGTAVEFSLELVKQLKGATAAQDIAASIHTNF
ncbi:DJ-1 family glyoxalase III [Pelagicoccus albus]|uniref:DJ-1/PfpI family protein n=1 Tax=Pelagicoccus albus TaxID=415222 RepID=A0A7X1B534_9BACT|nr:DJ-1 family glyoxalase III [Pelagicoccus albus]MBC2604708.1 DJ-1/PfpI family protein [Pelagicoccus albus]